MFPSPVQDTRPAAPSPVCDTAGAHLITLHAGRRGGPLTSAHLTSEFHAAVHLLALERWWRVRCAVLLPHRAHVVAALSPGTPPAAAAEELKRRLVPCLRRAGRKWETGHHTRLIKQPAELAEIFHGLFRESRQAGLCAEGESWTGYLCEDDNRDLLGALRLASDPSGTSSHRT